MNRRTLTQIGLRLRIAAAALSGKPIMANCTLIGNVSLGKMPHGSIIANNTITNDRAAGVTLNHS
jgi:hypothetical protein